MSISKAINIPELNNGIIAVSRLMAAGKSRRIVGNWLSNRDDLSHDWNWKWDILTNYGFIGSGEVNHAG